jgi:hypothetical protein
VTLVGANIRAMPDSAHILPVPVVGQRTGSECGNTVLTAMAQYFGRFYDSRDMGHLCTTDADGTNHASLIECARKIGAHVFAKNKGTVEEVEDFIRYGLPVAIGWWSLDDESYEHYDPFLDVLPEDRITARQNRDASHFSVLRGITETTLLFMDPQAGDNGRTIGYCEWRIRDFMPVWYDTDTEAYERVDGWYLAISYGDGFPPFVSKLGGTIYPPITPAARIGIGADWTPDLQQKANRAAKERAVEDVITAWKAAESKASDRPPQSVG